MVFAPVVGIPPGAVGGSEVLWNIDPGPAADYPVSADARCPCAPIAGIANVALDPAVFGPFPDVTMYLIEAPRVGLEAVDGHRALPILALGARSVRVVAVVVGLLRRDRRPPPEWCRRTSSRHVLPLGLRQKPIRFAGLARQPQCV